MNPTRIRRAAVAGLFYPAEAGVLSRQVDELLAAAQPLAGEPPKVLIAPHAGYVYSGPIAATAYAALRPAAARVRRVVLLGPAHRVGFRGLALPAAAAFSTPLGDVRIDAAAVEHLARLPHVVTRADAHADEHSLEVHLPFLQRVLGDFSLVPLVVGEASAAEVAAVLDALWGGDETLIVVSSDLSHYLPYTQARVIDARTAEAICQLRSPIDHHQACGATPIDGLLEVARRRRLAVSMLDLRNSGDTAGDRSRVVGYAAIAFREPPEIGKVVLPIARVAIAKALGVDAAPADVSAPWLRAPGASFVTLRQRGELRGCIGSLEPQRDLLSDLAENAVGAAMRDPRFPPLRRAEFALTRIEVSLLSGTEPVPCREEEELAARLRPAIDGVVLHYAGRRATFLPQVWDQLPDVAGFLAELKRKAGLPDGFWSPAIEVSRYTVAKFAEEDVR